MINNDNNGNQISEESFLDNVQPAKVKRIDMHYISHEIFHLLHLEKGFFYTVKELITKPGQSIREFINENRDKHMKPVPFLILTSLIYTLIAHFLHADEINKDKEQISFGQSSVNILNCSTFLLSPLD